MTGHPDITNPGRLIEDLGSKERRAVFKLQTGMLSTMTRRLVETGFSWILPVMLAKSTDPLQPDPGASIEKRIELEIYGETVRTMQSMIIHKMTLTSLGPERIFILSPNIRIESRERMKSGHHLYEFTQLDIEIAKGKVEDVLEIFEDLLRRSIVAVKENMHDELRVLERDVGVPKTPFEVYRKKELEEKYGRDWAESASEKTTNPIWITDIPREFYDFEDEDSKRWRNFDLILPEGYGEAASGSEREYEYSKIVSKLERDGIRKEDYDFMLGLAKDGRLKPSAGAGLGIERFVAYVCGVKHVAEVQPFPRIPGIVPAL